ncbi:MAG: tagaturonate epimerase family protein [Phycisphaerae bacterium]|nr:tagaturonate epimerase family protein [Phycisphaerae bacterium]
MILEKYSMGIGDRFAHQGKAQLQAMIQAKAEGVDIAPVWNKSHREHTTIKTSPADVRAEADAAVKALGWTGPYHVDADHIGLGNVDLFIESSDFFTLDVADFTGQAAEEGDIRTFVEKYKKYVGTLAVPGIDAFDITEEQIEAVAGKFLLAVKEAGKIYRHIESVKGKDNFITEVSMDETDEPQTPVEMFFILAAIADEGIPAQTIAPKFTGRFNKGVDYVGDVAQFAKEFDEDLAVIALAIKEFNMPASLKLSVHSGSDKFSIYAPIREALKKYDAGLHLKTAGTTWLEELIGLAMAGGEGLKIAKEVYKNALGRFDELCTPYATVIDIDQAKLPTPETVDAWSGEEYAAALRHDQSCEAYNQHFRQILHVGYKVAAEMGERYLNALEKFEEIVAKNVAENIYQRHLKRIFIGE